MSKKKEHKTNAARLLDKAGIKYEQASYGNDKDFLSGVEVSEILGESPDAVYKTLVTKGNSGEHYVAIIPSDDELNLKKLAKAAGEKSIEMINQDDILKVTGYVKGGCSPIGMKKKFETFIHDAANGKDYIYCSAGKRGLQLKLDPVDLSRITNGKFIDLAK